MDLFDIAVAKKLAGGGGGGGDVSIDALSITENGTYTAPSGHAYSPVTVSVPTGGGGDHDVEDALIERGSYYLSNSTATSVGQRACAYWAGLSGVRMDSVTSIGQSAFLSCANLSEAIFPKATTIGSAAFSSCIKLASISFPAATTISSGAFYRCSSLEMASFPNVKNIWAEAFNSCSKLISLYLLSNSAVNLSSANAFINTPMSSSTYTGSFGSIYVPASLVDTYKSKTYWSLYSSRITSYVE